MSRSTRRALLIGLALGFLLTAAYLRYLQTDDVSPDSPFGLCMAVGGTLLSLLVGMGYVLRKRLRRHWTGRLHSALAGHMVGGLLALLMLFFHAAGNYNARSGTYALLAWIALTLSGLTGKLIDRLAPRLLAGAALQCLSATGEDRLVSLERRAEARREGVETRRVASRPSGLGSAWDLAFHAEDLLSEWEAGASLRRGPHTARKEIIGEAERVRRALNQERFARTLIRAWRLQHQALTLLALSLLIWHITYALTLWM